MVESYRARNMDGVHDLLMRLGDLARGELRDRCVTDEVADTVGKLMRARRVLEVQVAGEKRLIAVEDAARYRDALGLPLPPGLPSAFLQEVPDAAVDLIRRFARTHGPFTTHEAALRYDLPTESVEAVLQRLVQSGKVVEGGFRPGGIHRSGAITRCCGRFGGGRWRDCGRRLSRLSRRRLLGCLRGGKAWCSHGVGWMHCLM